VDAGNVFGVRAGGTGAGMVGARASRLSGNDEESLAVRLGGFFGVLRAVQRLGGVLA